MKTYAIDLFFCFLGDVFAFLPLGPKGCWAGRIVAGHAFCCEPLCDYGTECACAVVHGHSSELVPQGELLGKTLIQAFAGQWKICNNSKSLMEINNFQIILYLWTDLLSSCVVNCYLGMNQCYVSLLWYCEHLWFSGQTHDSSKKGVNQASSSNSTYSMLFFQPEFLLIQLKWEKKLVYVIFCLQRFPHFHEISGSVPVCGLLILPLLDNSMMQYYSRSNLHTIFEF